jgi:hypothetical protein
VTLLRYWLAGSAVVLAAMATWAFAPVLLFIVIVMAVLGLLSAVMVAFARILRASRDRDPSRGHE